jgi:hypothetical protein
LWNNSCLYFHIFVLLPFWGTLALGLVFLLAALMAAAVTLVKGDY